METARKLAAGHCENLLWLCSCHAVLKTWQATKIMKLDDDEKNSNFDGTRITIFHSNSPEFLWLKVHWTSSFSSWISLNGRTSEPSAGRSSRLSYIKQNMHEPSTEQRKKDFRELYDKNTASRRQFLCFYMSNRSEEEEWDEKTNKEENEEFRSEKERC